jgi:hypothetical protein
MMLTLIRRLRSPGWGVVVDDAYADSLIVISLLGGVVVEDPAGLLHSPLPSGVVRNRNPFFVFTETYNVE